MQVTNFIKQYPITVFLIVLLLLSGCADLRNASSADIRQMVTLKTNDNSPDQFWVAPELQVRRYRLQFAGYDTVYYYLYNVKPTSDAADMHLRVHIDANYGGVVRHYDQAKLPDGFVFQTHHLQHDVVRCQLFGNMVDACLFRDRGDIELSKAELEAGRVNGLTLALSSASDQDYEHIDLPAAYIDGFLQALQNP
jgi:hypothetical protein